MDSTACATYLVNSIKGFERSVVELIMVRSVGSIVGSVIGVWSEVCECDSRAGVGGGRAGLLCSLEGVVNAGVELREDGNGMVVVVDEGCPAIVFKTAGVGGIGVGEGAVSGRTVIVPVVKSNL